MIELIEKYICQCRGINPEKLHERNKKGKLSRIGKYTIVRQLVIYYALQNGYTEEEAGGFYYLDHSTAHHCKAKIDDQRRIYRKFREEINEYDNKFKGLSNLNYKEFVDKLEYNYKGKIELIKIVLPELETKALKIQDQLNSIKSIIFDLQKETSRTDVEQI